MLRQQIIQDTLLHVPTTVSVLTNALCLMGLVLCFALAAVGTVYVMGPECEDKAILLPQTQVQQPSLLPTTVTPMPTTTTTTTIGTTCRVQEQQAPIPQAPRRASSCNVNLPRSAVAAF
jgi:hypothetical protein